MLRLGRASVSEGLSGSLVSVISALGSSGFAALGAEADGVSVSEELAADGCGAEKPPSLASLRRRICSIVSWSGASGAFGGCSFESIFVNAEAGEGRGRGNQEGRRNVRGAAGGSNNKAELPLELEMLPDAPEDTECSGITQHGGVAVSSSRQRGKVAYRLEPTEHGAWVWASGVQIVVYVTVRKVPTVIL